jgi:uncharacterized protein (TIGR00251 family)
MKTRLKLKVSTGKKASHTEWDNYDGKLLIEIKSNPEKGMANKEILKELKKLFKTEIKIVSGFTSREKIVEIDASEKEVFEKVKQN